MQLAKFVSDFILFLTFGIVAFMIRDRLEFSRNMWNWWVYQPHMWFILVTLALLMAYMGTSPTPPS